MNAVYYFVGFISGWSLRKCLKEGYDRMYDLGMRHGYERREMGMPLDYCADHDEAILRDRLMELDKKEPR